MHRRMRMVHETVGSMLAILLILVVFGLLSYGRFATFSATAFLAISIRYEPWKWQGIGREYIGFMIFAGVIAVAGIGYEIAIQLGVL